MKNDQSICPLCGGTLEEKQIYLDFRYKGRLIVVEGVPAQVCKDCGEQLISAETSRKIDVLLGSNVKPTKQINVPVLPFRHAAEA